MFVGCKNVEKQMDAGNAGNFAVQGDRIFYSYDNGLYSRNIDGSNNYGNYVIRGGIGPAVKMSGNGLKSDIKIRFIDGYL